MLEALSGRVNRARWWTAPRHPVQYPPFVQALNGILRGTLFGSIRGMNWLGDHSSLILFLLAPLFALFHHPITLLVIQSAALGLGALTIFWLARSELEDSRAALARSCPPDLPAGGALPSLVGMQMRWTGLVALVALVAVIAVGVWQFGRPRPAPPPGLNPPEDAIAQALRQARSDSAAAPGDAEDKSRWMAEVKGFDVSALSPGRRAMLVRFANAQRWRVE